MVENQQLGDVAVGFLAAPPDSAQRQAVGKAETAGTLPDVHLTVLVKAVASIISTGGPTDPNVRVGIRRGTQITITMPVIGVHVAIPVSEQPVHSAAGHQALFRRTNPADIDDGQGVR